MQSVYVPGFGMTSFAKPGQGESYVTMGATAVLLALIDAGLSSEEIEQAYAGFLYGDSCCGHRVLYEAGMMGNPIFNVKNNCSTGTSAIYLARQAIAPGTIDAAMVVSFEHMQRGALSEIWNDRPTPLEPFKSIAYEHYGMDESVPLTLALFACAWKDYRSRYNISEKLFGDLLSKITVKTRRHAVNNSKVVIRDPVTAEDVVNTPVFCEPITRLSACPPTCGATEAIHVSEKFAKKHSLYVDVKIGAQALTTILPNSVDPPSGIYMIGGNIAKRAADFLCDQASVDPCDIKLVEIHDYVAVNEFILSDQKTYGGRIVTNPSGGLLSKSHPVGATRLAQRFELVSQLRGAKRARQVKPIKLGLADNIGLGGSCVGTVYEQLEAAA